jgi:hypothetical protein
MRKAPLAAAVAIAALLLPSRASAWGFAGHRYIMGQALELLPPELKPFFDRYREEIVIRAIDPDLWRVVGWDEDPHHFLNLGAREFGPYPFAELPREYGAALEKFGIRALNRLGMLPWREAEAFGNLRRAFEGFKSESAFAPADLLLFTGMASHYIQDAHQPFHASNNYDGQLTGNSGIHARFERDLIERFLPRLTIHPANPTPIRNARDAAFDALLASYQLVDPILTADTEAVAGKDAYDDDYFEKFLAKVKPILEKRLADSISATAGIIIGAWEAAGKPTPRPEGARPLERVKK